MKKPEPVSKQVVCSVCDLPWSAHGDKPTIEKCVALLKAELAKRPRTVYPQTWLSAGSASPNASWGGVQ